MSTNPFVWTGPIKNGVARDAFCQELTADLKSKMGKSVFGIRGTGKSSFLRNELPMELIKRQSEDMLPWDTIYINLGEVVNITSFVTTIVSAMQELSKGSS